MKLSAQTVAVLVIAVGAGLITRSLFPVREEVIVPPVIHTEYDTVRVIDTAWVTQTIRETRWDTVYLERVIATVPETLRVCPEVRGLTVLTVPAKVGDSTLARGFQIQRQDTSILWSQWETRWWTPGPLRAFSLDTFPPRVAFDEALKVVKPCGTLCKVGHYLIGGAIGRASCWVK